MSSLFTYDDNGDKIVIMNDICSVQKTVSLVFWIRAICKYFRLLNFEAL